MNKLMVAVAVMTLGALVMVGCGGKSCTTLWEEAQAGKCTAIKGNCGTFCAALDAEYSNAGCSGQYDDYQSCLSAGCDTGCDTQENSLRSCMTSYCIKNLGNANCNTMASSF